MVSSSLNLASLCGIALVLWWLFSAPAACFQVWFILTRRADTSPAVIIRAILSATTGLCRIIGLPSAGIILFMEGWRLDPILQWSIVILCILLLAESSNSVASDFSQWRRRLGRAVAVIDVEKQPDDDA